MKYFWPVEQKNEDDKAFDSAYVIVHRLEIKLFNCE